MNRIWSLSWVVAVALGLQACDQQPPRTTMKKWARKPVPTTPWAGPFGSSRGLFL